MSFRIEFFDLWQANYGGASVAVYLAGTSTLASLYTDEALTVAAGNPQTLLSLTRNGVTYGKFANPLYTGAAYEMTINSTDETGIIRPPLTGVAGEDASDAEVTVGSESRTLADLLVVPIDVEDYGEFLPVTDSGASSSTNTASLVAAIGVAASQGGGEVILPAGTFAFTTMAIPTGVLVRGQGRGVTVLQSSQASNIVTFSGDRAGFADLTLDGVSNVSGSVGVFWKAKNEVRIYDSLVKNFGVGLRCQGGERAAFYDLYVDNCATGAKFYGDQDASGDSAGGVFKFNRWAGGLVTNCTSIGIDLSYFDMKCWHNEFVDIGFEDNTGVGIKINGARYTELDGCWWTGNTNDIQVLDGTDVTVNYENTVVGVHVDGGEISGNMSFAGKCQDIVFKGVEFSAGTYTLTAPKNAILALDCIEGADVTLAGTDTTKWVRARSGLGDFPSSAGVTTDETPTVAWSYTLEPGEFVNVDAIIIANGRNNVEHCHYHIASSAARLGSTLDYDAQTANFTLGDTITGGTSGVTALVTADSDGGATGTLTLRNISGEFLDNEIITGATSGSAAVNGVLTHQDAVLIDVITQIQQVAESAGATAFACTFTVSGFDVQVTVTGAAANTIDWTVAAQVTSG